MRATVPIVANREHEREVRRDGLADALDLSADWRLEQASDNDRSQLRPSVLQLAHALRRLASSADIRKPTRGTRAHDWGASTANSPSLTGTTHLDNIVGGIGTVCLGAASQMDVLVDSVIRRRATVAVWTLTRAIVESLARVNYLLSAGDVVELLSRHVTLIRAELKYANLNEYLVQGQGLLDVPEYLSHLENMVVEIGGTIVKPPSYTQLATDLLEETAPENGSRARYSQLSGVAHGELPGLQMFRLPDGGLGLPRILLMEAVHIVGAVGIVVGDKLGDFVALPNSGTFARWNSARDRAFKALLAFQ
jgi:hypothetical protein